MKQIFQKQRPKSTNGETEMQLKAAKVGTIHLYSGCLCDNDMNLTGVTVVDSLIDAVQMSVDTFKDNHVAVILRGPYVIPRCG